MSSPTRIQITVVTILLASLWGTPSFSDEATRGGECTAGCDETQQELGCTTASCQLPGTGCGGQLQPWAAGGACCGSPRVEPSCGCNGPVEFSISDGGCCGQSACGRRPCANGCLNACGSGCCGGGCCGSGGGCGGCGKGCSCGLFNAIFGTGCPTCGCDPCPDSVGGLRVRGDGPGSLGCCKAKCGGGGCCGGSGCCGDVGYCGDAGCGDRGFDLAKFSRFRKKDGDGCGGGCHGCCGQCGQCGQPCVGLLGKMCGCGKKCGCGKTCGGGCGCNAAGGAYHCGMPAPQYPCPYYTPRPTAPTYISYAPLAPHNSLPQYRSTYSFKHGCGMSRTTVHWRPTTVCNAFDYLHNCIEIPR
ncbi:MAG: hypothetical protein AAGF97_04385 [Planctomycetota bacterium]